VITVKRAYTELGLAGIIVTRHGMGSFVAESSELPTSLLRAEFSQHFDAMLACAARLGISRNDIRKLLAEQPDPATATAPESEGPTP
jgi:GntR family transcriptional regulator